MRPIALAAVVALLVSATAPAGAAPTGVDDKRREAQRIEREIAQRGERLSIATEEFNKARLARQGLETRLGDLRRERLAAQERWNELKDRFSQRARVLYMHPGSWAQPVLESGSINDLARARVLSGTVLMSDTELLQRTKRARSEVSQREKQLDKLKVQARDNERRLQERQSLVSREVGAQQRVLSSLRGDIATLVEAEQRRRELDEVRAVRSAPRSVAAAAPPAGRPQSSIAPGSNKVKASPGASAAPQKAAAPVKSGAGKAVATAAAQIGKPYKWGGAGPDSFDCSGLTQYAWASAGVSLPHSSQAQYNALPKVDRSQLQPGDLVFFGNPIHHVGIYEGGGSMIAAPQTGEKVRRQSIDRRDYRGAARP
ncbi:MAG TPA: NlpC/P60 family protein [Actinomycetota bacterium]|nr:NlpC/P60 family protein [Actinomycetota bacterium]